MDEALNIVGGLAALIGVAAFWVLVLFIIPGVLAVYAGKLVPLTGQWRKRWAERRERRRQLGL